MQLTGHIILKIKQIILGTGTEFTKQTIERVRELCSKMFRYKRNLAAIIGLRLI